MPRVQCYLEGDDGDVIEIEAVDIGFVEKRRLGPAVFYRRRSFGNDFRLDAYEPDSGIIWLQGSRRIGTSS